MRPLLCVLGASGSGKSTLCSELEKRYGLKSIPSYTTRAPRFNVEQGHTFVTENEFDKLEEILAYAKTDNCRYAVTKEMFENKNYSLYVVDLTGLKYLYKHYRGNRPIISVFLRANAYDRFNHMINRKDERNEEEIIRAALERIEHDAVEFNEEEIKNNVNYIFDNYEGQFELVINLVERICKNYGIIKEHK